MRAELERHYAGITAHFTAARALMERLAHVGYTVKRLEGPGLLQAAMPDDLVARLQKLEADLEAAQQEK